MKDMAFDYSMLKKRIREQFGSVTEFCQSCGIDEADFLEKVNNKNALSIGEAEKIANALEIPLNERASYFFSH